MAQVILLSSLATASNIMLYAFFHSQKYGWGLLIGGLTLMWLPSMAPTTPSNTGWYYGDKEKFKICRPKSQSPALKAKILCSLKHQKTAFKN